MTMVSTGPISIGGSATSGGLNQSINIELGRAATATTSLNEAAVRTLAGVPSGAISLSNFYGKSNAFIFSFAGGTNVNLRTAAVNAGWNQNSLVIATNTGTVQSASTGTAALIVSGSFPNGVQLVNNGLIVGRGGDGGMGVRWGTSTINATPGLGGGTALSVSVALQVTNNGTVAGGGGGGGGGEGRANRGNGPCGSSGGGGIGFGTGGAAATRVGSTQAVNGNAGGNGTATAVGQGGAGVVTANGTGGAGGNGGGYGSAGLIGGLSGPGTGATGVAVGARSNGGGGGAATSGNANITWLATGTRLGALN